MAYGLPSKQIIYRYHAPWVCNFTNYNMIYMGYTFYQLKYDDGVLNI